MKGRPSPSPSAFVPAVCAGLLLLSSGCSSSDSGHSTVTTPFTVVAIGDSVTAGVDAGGEMNAYPQLLQDQLREEGYVGADVDNQGIPGTNFAYWSGSIASALPAAGAMAVIIELGTNDALPEQYDPARIRSEILAIEQEVYAAGSVPFFVTPPGVCDENRPVYMQQEINTLEIAEIMRELIDSKRIIDASKQFHKNPNRCTDLMATRNHPNERGQELIAKLSYSRVEPVIDEATRPDEPADPVEPTLPTI